jgi:hypothetical protein
MTTVIWLFIINLFAIILSHILLYFKTYTKEKGKNLATKEDIEEITQKVETVKSDINLLTQKRINYNSEKYNALIDYNNRYSAWLFFIVYTHISGEADKADEFKEKTEEKLDNLFHDFLIAEAKFDVYFIDTDFIPLSNVIKIKTIELSNHTSKFLVTAAGTNSQIAMARNLTDFEYKKAQLAQLYDSILQILEEYNKEKNELYKKLAPLNYQFTRMIQAEIAKM